MKKTLQLISIQHELGMAIGLDLMLAPMLKHFTKTCVRRLGLAELHFYFYRVDRCLAVPDLNLSVELEHYTGFPVASSGACSEDVSTVFRTLQGDEGGCYSEYRDESDEYLYFFNLGLLGLVSLHRYYQPVDETILNLLIPVFKRLTTSCQASIEHEQLLHVMQQRDEAEKTIRFQLEHDELTQLPNRRMLLKTLNRKINALRKKGGRAAALFIDLDRFKIINDTLGHAVGDSLLKAVAGVFVSLVGSKHFVARLSGDEFVVLLVPNGDRESLSDAFVVEVLAEIRQAFSRPVKAGRHVLDITPSIGVEFFPKDELSADDVLRHADRAMYIAKSNGPNSSVIYDEGMSVELVQRQQIEGKLQAAMKDTSQFGLVYQPQYNIHCECIGAEVLVRWKGENIPPSQFIPVAEETGLMLDLGRWILSEACDQIKKLEGRELQPQFKHLMVNVSALQFNRSDFVSELVELTTAKNVAPGSLGIELTESVLIKNMDDMVRKITTLRSLGFYISIDDFGTGYSSLAYLSRFPINTLKIDQAFVRNAHKDAGNRAVIETIMALGTSLNLSIIAEGVESREEFEILKGIGCESFQGYLFSRPVEFDELQKVLGCNEKINQAL